MMHGTMSLKFNLLKLRKENLLFISRSTQIPRDRNVEFLNVKTDGT